jgi:hypothetical protein
MLSEKLIDLPPKEEYEQLPDNCVFIGVKIKNLYDEKRICITDNYAPKRYISKNGVMLFGMVKEVLNEHKLLMQNIKQQKIFDLIGYNLLLQDHKLTCNECYFNLNPPLYPVDNVFIKKYINDFDFENFICFNPDIPKFQAFASLNLYFYI